MAWKICGINHVGLAPKDPAKAQWFLREVLGLSFLGDELVGSQQTLTSMFRHDGGSLPRETQGSGQRLEVLAPAPQGEGPIAKFLDKKGSGIHHLALTVDRLDNLLAELKSKSIRMIDETPRLGAHGTNIAFVHPESTGGLLIELVEESETTEPLQTKP